MSTLTQKLFLKVPSLITTFRGRFVNPVSENSSEPSRGDAYGYHLGGKFRIELCRRKVFSHIRTFGPPKVKPPQKIFLD